MAKESDVMVDPFETEVVEKAKQSEMQVVKIFGGSDAGKGTGTKQIPKDHFEKSSVENQLIRPLYDPIIWASLPEQNTRLKTLINSMANNTVGLGWEIVPRSNDEEFLEQNSEGIKKEQMRFAEIIEEINPKIPFNEMMKHVKVDEEATGMGYYEVVRSVKGDEVKQLFHLQSHTIRRAKAVSNMKDAVPDMMHRSRWVQMWPGDPKTKVWFKEFGEEAALDATTGKWQEEQPVTDPANELVDMMLYTPRSSFYGIPRVVSAAPAIAGTRLAHRRNVSFFENDAPMALTTPILTPNGWSTMGAMAVGGDVIGSDGKRHAVTEVIPQGVKPVYRVTFKDGTSTNSTAGHIWTVANSYDKRRGVTRDITLQDIIDEGTHYPSGDSRWSIPMIDPVEFAESLTPLPIDPYLMGFYLGNGWSSGSQAAVAVNMHDADEFEDGLPGILPKGVAYSRRDRILRADYIGCATFAFTQDGASMLDKLRGLSLYGCGAATKFIPEAYLRASVADRVSVLQGLIDSDGHIGDTAIRYVTISRALADDVAELVGSLGGTVTIRGQKNRRTLQLTIQKLPAHIKPFRAVRKGSKWRDMQSPRWRTIERVEYWKDTPTQCIRVDTEDSLYVVEHFILTHNTPRMGIVVSGGSLSTESMDMIEEFVNNKSKGPGNNGRVMVLQASGDGDILGEGKQVKIEIVPLTIGVTDDASFVKYTEANNEEVRECFSIGQIFIGTAADVNRAVALATKQLTVEQAFEPETRRYEYRLNKVIMKTNGAKYTKLRFTRPKTVDNVAESQALNVLASAGGVTPNDIREFLKKPKFNGKWADTPLALLKLSLLEDKKEELATLLDAYGDSLPTKSAAGNPDDDREPGSDERAKDGGAGPTPDGVTEQVNNQASKETLAADFEAHYGPKVGKSFLKDVQSIAQKLEKQGVSITINSPRPSVSMPDKK